LLSSRPTTAATCSRRSISRIRRRPKATGSRPDGSSASIPGFCGRDSDASCLPVIRPPKPAFTTTGVVRRQRIPDHFRGADYRPDTERHYVVGEFVGAHELLQPVVQRLHIGL
jgi:hypothetical protein